MCMKVRVTEKTLQETCHQLEESGEHVEQTSISKYTQSVQLNDELRELLMFICQQKRVNLHVPSLSLSHTIGITNQV